MTAKQATVLVVEDDPNDVLLIQRAFKKAQLDLELQITNDGQEAIDFLSGVAPSSSESAVTSLRMILLDLKLPLKNGFEVLEWIRSHPDINSLPVIVLTSSKECPDVQRAYRLGANSYLVKPVVFQELAELIDRMSYYWTVHNETPCVTLS
ncbi:hypothetical protein MNBD_PLANCTO02-2162 [hydrothermal vent metagenome]|uniref:Response regulatory domain-containing protein n=1 Tax=hydrothermal vent metagenome TaxID=652676 RepID=A0A3B1DJ31_9ZZZZ